VRKDCIRLNSWGCEIDADRQRVLELLRAAVADRAAHTLRVKCADSVAEGLTSAGKMLYVGGWFAKSRQVEGVGTLAEMAAELALQSVSAYRNNCWYAGAALIRQLIETEYLMFLFSRNPVLAENWLDATPEIIRSEFAPGKMRKQAAGQFRDEEYWLHCDSGGHPSPAGRHLLASHSDAIGSKEIHWLDLAQHLSRLWYHFCHAIASSGADDYLPKAFLLDVSAAVDRWRAGDNHRAIEGPPE
jgi:hypothetical protein